MVSLACPSVLCVFCKLAVSSSAFMDLSLVVLGKTTSQWGHLSVRKCRVSAALFFVVLPDGQCWPVLVQWYSDGKVVIVVAQLPSHVQLFVTPWTAARQASLSFTISRSLLKLMSIESVMPSNHLILCHPLLLLPSVFPSISIFSSESALHLRWPKYWSFSFSISPFNEFSRLISFRMNWLDLLAVQGTLKSLFQHNSSKNINSLVLSLIYGPSLTYVKWSYSVLILSSLPLC